ncbi:MAG TPA: D-2-hydroxyacid dehydrogenase [Terracidiphilus sp.]|nr:D-2-hydroxyacid dehydrogenase [Terracidiphilus sp.]
MTNRPKLLIVAKQADPEFALLEDVPWLLASDASAAAAAQDATAILHWSGTREMLRDAFLQCGRLRWVHSRWAGLDNLLFPELVNSDAVLTNGKGVFSQSLGEFALTAILYFAKDIPRMRRNQAAHAWAPFDVEMISGRVLGIVGYGDIGRAVATRAQAMGMRILAVKRHPPAEPDPLIERYYRTTELRTMLAQCDYIVNAAPLTEETRHMLGAAEFAAMKPEAVVINVGRGAVIDEAAMVHALQEKRIRGAGLDVFEHEPLAKESPLYEMESVLLSPHCADHIAGWTEDAMRFFLEQYRSFEKNEPLLNPVNKSLGY